MTKIEERITELRIESATLQQNHDAMIAAHQETVKLFQERVAANQNRFQQIAGAIAELEAIQKDGQEPKEEKKDGKQRPK
jgi:hypothetical protein